MDRQEHFLDDLFRLRLIPNELERLSVDPGDVLAEDRLKGPVVAGLHPLDEHPLFVVGSPALCRRMKNLRRSSLAHCHRPRPLFTEGRYQFPLKCCCQCRAEGRTLPALYTDTMPQARYSQRPGAKPVARRASGTLLQ